MDRKIIPTAKCEAILAYSIQVPPILESVYSEEIANQIGLTLAEVFEARSLAEVILAASSPESKAELKALTSSIKAAAGQIKATASVLRAM